MDNFIKREIQGFERTLIDIKNAALKGEIDPRKDITVRKTTANVNKTLDTLKVSLIETQKAIRKLEALKRDYESL